MIAVIIEDSVLCIQDILEVGAVYLYLDILLIKVIICSHSGKLARLMENICGICPFACFYVLILFIACVIAEDIDYGDIDYKTVSESGQSFVRVSCSDDTVNDWKDLTSSGIKEYLNVDFEPNNCCIKALYQ